MIAYITADGVLTVKSETGIEHFALSKWWEGWCYYSRQNISTRNCGKANLGK